MIEQKTQLIYKTDSKKELLAMLKNQFTFFCADALFFCQIK